MTAELCPTPDKKRFATLPAAEDAARRAGFALQKSLRPYTNCPCGWIHLTSREEQRAAREPLLTDGPVDDLMFALVTRDDVMGKAPQADAEILRAPENLVRWADALKTFQIDLGAQMAQKQGCYDDATKAWRKRIRVVEKRLREKRAEAKRLMYLHITCTDSSQAANRVRYASREARTNLKERKRIAGERAIARLKDAHPDEFKRYLAEEYIVDGLDLTGSLPDHAPEEKEKET